MGKFSLDTRSNIEDNITISCFIDDEKTWDREKL